MGQQPKSSPPLGIFLDGDFWIPVGAVFQNQAVCHMAIGDFDLYAHFNII